MPLLLSSLSDKNPFCFSFLSFLPSISRYCPKCQQRSDTSACCASQIDRAAAAAEKTALAAGPISSALLPALWLDGGSGWRGAEGRRVAASVSRENGGCETHDILSRLPILQNLTLQKKTLPTDPFTEQEKPVSRVFTGDTYICGGGPRLVPNFTCTFARRSFPPTVHNCKQQLSRFLS